MATPKFFYTKNYPHKWGSGPTMITWGDDGYISSLEEAAELAKKHAVDSFSDDRCVTTFGVYFDQKEFEEEIKHKLKE